MPKAAMEAALPAAAVPRSRHQKSSTRSEASLHILVSTPGFVISHDTGSARSEILESGREMSTASPGVRPARSWYCRMVMSTKNQWSTLHPMQLRSGDI